MGYEIPTFQMQYDAADKKTFKLEFIFMKHYAPNRCEPSIEALNYGGRGDQGRCERRSEVFVKFQKICIYF